MPKCLMQPTLARTLTWTKTMVSPCAHRKKANAETSRSLSSKKAIQRQLRLLVWSLERHAPTRSNPTAAHQLSRFKMELLLALNLLSLNLRKTNLRRLQKGKARARDQKRVCHQEASLSQTQETKASILAKRSHQEWLMTVP